MKTLLRILTHPVFLSLIPFLIICSVVPLGSKKYVITQESKNRIPENQYIVYDDLDFDGVSEEIFAFSTDNTTALSVYKNGVIIDQWNFRGSYDFWFLDCLFITGDSDHDHRKEIYVFTLNQDSVLLNCIPDFTNPGLSIKNRLISIAGKGLKSPDPFIIPAEMDDLDGDGIEELIFGIGSGFSIFPRRVFAYYVAKDSLIQSPKSSYFIRYILQADINNDGRKEIMPSGYATSNIGPVEAEYHDHSAFLMVLDQNLKFLFKPLEFKGKYSVLTPVLLTDPDKPGTRVGWQYYNNKEGIKPTFYFMNSSGSLSDSVSMNYKVLEVSNMWKGGLLHVYTQDGIGLLNNDFKLIKNIPGVKPGKIIPGDFDHCGTDEVLFLDPVNNMIHLFREEYTNGLSVPAEISSQGSNLVSVKKENGQAPIIHVQSGRNHYLYSYGKNPAYPYFYLYYPATYLSILAFALLIKNIQKTQSRKKYEMEKKISELQLALIRNQLDPHFTFNVINSIIYSVEVRENDNASEQLRQFAVLYRNMLLSAGSTRRTIDEELSFCENYLQLEKMRFKEKFNYCISVEDCIDRSYLIPKFIIQIHAENAIKHGISAKEEGGMIYIEIKNADESLSIIITDNGIGRAKSAAQEKSSTGKGLRTMEELFSIYNKYYKEEISSEIIDLYDPAGEPSGTSVCIRIRKTNDKS